LIGNYGLVINIETLSIVMLTRLGESARRVACPPEAFGCHAGLSMNIPQSEYVWSAIHKLVASAEITLAAGRFRKHW